MTRLVLTVVSFAFGISAAQSSVAQSTLPDFPTPVSTSELSGAIKPRDVGDSRLTTYYYFFEGSQGDVFVNLVTKNFAGDIDVFLQNGLRPLTKDRSLSRLWRGRNWPRYLSSKTRKAFIKSPGKNSERRSRSVSSEVCREFCGRKRSGQCRT